MRHSTAIILRKIRGVFGACWQGAPTSFVGGGSAIYPAAPNGAALLGALRAFLLVLLPALLMLALVAATAAAAPEHTGTALFADAGAGTLATKELIEKLQGAFSEFKDANNERIKALEANKAPDPLVLAKVDAANAKITELKVELDEVRAAAREQETANARIGATRSDVRDADMQHAQRFFSLTRGKRVVNVTADDLAEYKAYHEAFGTYLRQGQAAFRDADIRDALTTGAAPSGGFWLTPDSSGRIVEYLEDLSSMRRLASVSPIGTDTFEGYYDLDEASSGWVGETDTRSETNTPRLDGKYSYPIFEQYANPKASQKMLDDSETDVETWLAKKVAQKMAKTENSAFVNGDGLTKPKGFLTYTAGTPARTSVANYRKIRQLTTGVSAGFAATKPGDKLIDLIQSLPSELRKGGAFVMNQLTAAEVRKLVDGQGNYLFIPDFSKNPNGSILNYAIEELNDMPDISAASLSIAFANMKEAYEIKDHTVGTRVLRDPYTGKPYVSFYTTKRVGGDVVNFQAITLLKFS
jgi:HK97 family phage major capsid protein